MATNEKLTAKDATETSASPAAPPEKSSVDEPKKASSAKPNQSRGSTKRGGNTLNISELKEMSISKLSQVAKDLNVAGASGMRKQDLIFQILKEMKS